MKDFYSADKAAAKQIIATLLALTDESDILSAIDTVNSCEEQINDFRHGKKYGYETVEQIIQDWLGLDERYAWIFAEDWD